jgi:hypothetical protein
MQPALFPTPSFTFALDALLQQIDQQIEVMVESANGRPVIARLLIKGRGQLHRSLNRANVLADLVVQLRESGSNRNPFIWIEKLESQTRPEIDLQNQLGSQDFLGDLLRLLQDVRETPEELDRIRGSLSDLFNHSKAGRFLDSPSDAELHELLDRAQDICVDLLIEEDS